MRKEIVFAVLLGLFVGLIIAFFVWYQNSNPINEKEISIESTSSPLSTLITPSPTAQGNPNNLSVKIISPKQMSVSLLEKTNIRGVSKANSLIIVSSQIKDYITSTDANGVFDVEVELPQLINEFKISASSDKGYVGSNSIVIIRASEAKQSDTEYTAFLGSITDITDKNIQLTEFVYGEEETKKTNTILQVSILSDTTYGGSKEKKNMAIFDLAIGDFVVVIGNTKTGGVILANRIVVSSPYTPIAVKHYYGNVTGTNKTIVTLRPANVSNDIDFITSKESKISLLDTNKLLTKSVNDIKEGAILSLVEATNSEGKKIARRIVLFNLGSKPSPSPSPKR